MSSVFADQKALLQSRMQAVTEKIVTKQQELQLLQAEKHELQQAFADLRAAYLAWKGTAL